jgi:GMP synthase (glutamine-hydrolysing)
MILIIDFGSQYNQLIARRVREYHVYCRIDPPAITVDKIKTLNPDGIILSGGPASVYEKNSPKTDPTVFDLGIPVLGICYGMHFMISALGGTVEGVGKREYGFAELNIKKADGLFEGVHKKSTCWMSHGDSIRRLPRGFRITASTPSTKIAAAVHAKKDLFGFQYHPEVAHTQMGKKMLRNFLFNVCGCKRNWTMKSFARRAIEEIRSTVADKKSHLGIKRRCGFFGGGPAPA